MSKDMKSLLETMDSLRNDAENQERERAIEASPHKQQVYELAAKYLLRFFAGKNGADGKPIQKTRLLTYEHLSTVLNTAMCPGIDLFYETLSARRDTPDEDIRYLVTVLHEARRLHIPQNLIGGIACVHAQLVGSCWDRPGFAEPIEEEADPEDDSDEVDQHMELEFAGIF